jgi:hypothetical protein
VQIIIGNSYFSKTGYLKSLLKKNPLDSDGHPVPWWTYSFTDFLIKRLNIKMNVFEYGSGNSTLFLAPFVNSIHSVEHDQRFYERIKNKCPKNVVLSKVNQDEYVESIGDSTYDMVIIDGINRNLCCYRALRSLSSDGVIVFDDTDRSEYDSAYIYLKNNGFKRIDFVGISPCSIASNSTSIFYRSANVLKI